MKKRYIRHASELVTCKGSAPKHGKEMSDIGLIKDGAVIIHDDKIVATGTTEELDRQVDLNEYEVIDAAGKTVMPGFVDSHTHFIFGGYRADEFSWRLKGDSYMSIMERGGGINATVVPTREATEEELIEAGEERLNRMLEFGVTTVEGKSGYGMDCETELKQLRVMKKLDETCGYCQNLSGTSQCSSSVERQRKRISGRTASGGYAESKGREPGRVC